MDYQVLSFPEKWILKGIPLIFCIGSLLHFLFDLSRRNVLIGLIAPVNQSVWEHLKMIPLPVIGWWTLYYIAKGITYGMDKDIWFTSALIALVTSLITVPLLYYFYTQAFGIKLLWVDILILLLAIAFGQSLALYCYREGVNIPAVWSMVAFSVLILVFILFTFVPPKIPLFLDHTNGQYGFPRSKTSINIFSGNHIYSKKSILSRRRQ